MTVSTTDSRIAYTGDGSTTAFAVNFYFLENADLKVYLDGTLKTITTHYTISGAGNPAGGTVTFLSAPAAAASVVIFRDPALTQETDYTPNDPFPAESHEEALDRLTMISQRLSDRLDRSFVLPDSDISGADLTLPTPTARKGIRWNDAGNGLENTTDDVNDLATASAASAAAAAASASSASTSASSASTSASAASTSASNASTSATNASSSATAAASSASSASTSATNASESAAAASASETAAAGSASSASTSASNASTSAAAAAVSASNAATSETNAAASASSAAASYDSFDDRYLGAKASDPTLDNDGAALLEGALYWNTVSKKMRVYDGSAWADVSSSTNFAVQTFNGTGAQTAFTLTVSPGTVNALFVYISGVRQTPTTDYTLSGTTLTFTTAPASGTANILVVSASAQDIGTPSDGTVTAAKLDASFNATLAKLGDDQTFTGANRGTVTTDNDASFDMSVTNNFSCTLSGAATLTFTNITAGQSGNILLVNGSNYTVSAAATTKCSATALSTLSASGTYWISYYSPDGTNVYISTTGALS